jgi:hypothetical protein
MKRRLFYVSHFQSGNATATVFVREGKTTVYLGVSPASFTRLWKIAVNRQVNPFAIPGMPGWQFWAGGG